MHDRIQECCTLEPGQPPRKSRSRHLAWSARPSSGEAIAKLHDFLQSIDTSVPDGPRFADASEALRILVSHLEIKGTASDDDWQRAIETMLSLANEAG
jgi:hypothetical protein